MEEGNFEDLCESTVKSEPEDILSLPVEVFVCPENETVDEDEWVSGSSEQLSTDPLATNLKCEIEEASMSIDSSPKTASFATDLLESDIASESYKSGKVEPSNSMVLSEELDLGVCQVDDEIGGTSQKMEVPHNSVNDIINLPPVHADPDPEQTRRLLDCALQKIISQVTKRKGRKRRASQLLNDEMRQQNKSAPEFSSPLSTQQMNDSLLSSPKDLIDPKLSIPSIIPVKSRALPINVRKTSENKSTPVSLLNNSEVEHLSPAIEPLTVNQADVVLTHDTNFSPSQAKKPRKSAKSLQQHLKSKKHTSPISTGSPAVLSTNLSPSSVPVISELCSSNKIEKSPFRATGGDPCPAGGSPAAAGANAMAEEAQEAGDSRILSIPHLMQLKMRNILKKVSQEARPQTRIDADTINKDIAINLGKEKQIVAPSRSTLSQKNKNFLRHTLSSGPTPICNLCGRGFSSYCELMSHLRLHTASGRRFFCSSCKSRFGHAQALASHVRKRHGIEVPPLSAGGWQRPFAYSCNSCNKFYELRAKLNNHLLDKHRAARSKVVNGVATALMGMTRMRGAIPKELSGPVPKSTVLKTSSFLNNQSHPLSNSNVNSEEEEELNSDSCSQASHPSSVTPYVRKRSLSHSPVSTKGTLLPTSIRSCSRSSEISSTSSSSIKSSSEMSSINIAGYDFIETQEMQRSKTTTRSHCPVHSKVTSCTNIKFVKNSKYAKKRQLTSKSSATKHANYSPQVVEDQPHTTSKIFDSRDKPPCPVHKSSHETVREFVPRSKKIISSKASRKTSSFIGKPVPEPVISLICDKKVMSPSPHVSDCEFLGSSVTSVTSTRKSSISKAVNRSVSPLSTSTDSTGHKISKNIKKMRHSFPTNSSCLTSTIPKLQKIQTKSPGNVSLYNTNPAHNKIARPPYVNGNTYVPPLSTSLNHIYQASSKLTNEKRNSFPPYTSSSFTDPKLQKIDTCVKKSSNCRNLESKNMQRSSFSHNSRAVVVLENIKGLPNSKSSTSAKVDRPYVGNHVSQSSTYDSNFLANSKNKVNHTRTLATPYPIVLLNRIDHLVAKKLQ